MDTFPLVCGTCQAKHLVLGYSIRKGKLKVRLIKFTNTFTQLRSPVFYCFCLHKAILRYKSWCTVVGESGEPAYHASCLSARPVFLLQSFCYILLMECHNYLLENDKCAGGNFRGGNFKRPRWAAELDWKFRVSRTTESLSTEQFSFNCSGLAGRSAQLISLHPTQHLTVFVIFSNAQN